MEDIPEYPEHARTYVAIKEQFEKLPEAIKNRYIWEILRCQDGIVRAFGSKKNPFN